MSEVIRLNKEIIPILEEYRTRQIETYSKYLKEDYNDITARSIWQRDIERFKKMSYSELITDYIRTQDYIRKHYHIGTEIK